MSDRLAEVPTVTQGEKCRLRRGRHVAEVPYTNYDRYPTTYRTDVPVQQALDLHNDESRPQPEG